MGNGFTTVRWSSRLTVKCSQSMRDSRVRSIVCRKLVQWDWIWKPMRSQQTIQQFALPRADGKGLRVRPGNVPKNGDACVRPRFLYQARQQPKVVVLGQKHRLFRAVHLLQDGLRKLPVCLLVMLPVGKPKNRPRVRNMAKRPEAFVGETVVIAFLFFFCKPDSTQAVPRFLGRNPHAVMRIDRLAGSIAAAVSHPRSVART